MIKIVDGNLLEFECQYIAHQCNCVTIGSGLGLAQKIFEKYPESSIYEEGIERKLGEIIVRSRVINMLSQHYLGKPKFIESKETRLLYFSKCMEKIFSIKGLKSVAFPHGIGCGLACGDWEDYFEIIDAFAEDNPDIEVFIVKYGGSK